MKITQNSVTPFLYTAGFLAVAAWVVTSIAICWWFNVSSSLTSQDLIHVSWLVDPSATFRFTDSFFGCILALALFVCGFLLFSLLFTGLVSRGHERYFINAASSALIMALLLSGVTEKSATSLGLLDGTAKIGCFVEDTKECVRLLSLHTTGAYSMYAQDSSSKEIELSSQYVKQRNKVISSYTLQTATVMYTYPIYWLKAPLYLFKLNSLPVIINAQRQHIYELQTKKL